MLNKIDKEILKSVKKTIIEQNDMEFVLIGGRALNYILSDIRLSNDSDIALKSAVGNGEISKSKFKKTCRNIRLGIENDFNITIVRSNNPKEHKINIADGKNCYFHNNFVYKIYLNLNNEDYILEISYDETIPKFDYVANEEFDNIISLKSAIAIKTVISSKRIDENTILLRENYRHLYDLYRLLKEEGFDYENFREQIYIAHEYELTRKGSSKYKYKIDIKEIPDVLNDVINSEKLLNEIIGKIKETWDVDVEQTHFSEVMNLYILKLKEIL